MPEYRLRPSRTEPGMFFSERVLYYSTRPSVEAPTGVDYIIADVSSLDASGRLLCRPLERNGEWVLADLAYCDNSRSNRRWVRAADLEVADE